MNDGMISRSFAHEWFFTVDHAKNQDSGKNMAAYFGFNWSPIESVDLNEGASG